MTFLHPALPGTGSLAVGPRREPVLCPLLAAQFLSALSPCPAPGSGLFAAGMKGDIETQGVVAPGRLAVSGFSEAVQQLSFVLALI